MCGIAGILSRRADAGIGSALRRMADAMAHRGPDGQGFAVADNGQFYTSREGLDLPPARLGLAHRRLSIIDLTDAASQPMCDATGQRALTFNGEIYNFLELRKAWLDQTPRKSAGDTEVLLRTVADGGVEALNTIVGMFSFGFVDIARNTLLLARDFSGIKPLYYISTPDRFAFASELRPLIPLLDRAVADAGAVHRFLRHGYTDAGETTFIAGIRQVQPGCALEVDLRDPSRVRKIAWWQRSPERIGAAPRTAASAAEELRALFIDSVRLHLRADIPVATTLSGGIDSSAIVAAVRSIAKESAEVHAFTYRADDPALDESSYAQIAADAAGVVRHDVRVSPEKFADDLDDMICLQEQPFTTMSIYAQTAVFRAIHASGFKVAMDGQGADEMFAGYPVLRAARVAGLLRRGKIGQAVSLGRVTGRRGALMGISRLIPHAVATPLRQMLGRAAVPFWADARWFARHAGNKLESTPAGSSLREELGLTFARTSLPMLLRYADRNAMASSVENRVPFLTPALVRFASRLPEALLIDQSGTTKRVLRDALRGLVPDPILDRKDKIGFQAPEHLWIAQSARLRDRLKDILADQLPGCFSPAFGVMARQTLDAHRYDPAVWRGLCLMRWSSALRVELPA